MTPLDDNKAFCEANAIQVDSPWPEETPPSQNLLVDILARWRIILITVVIVCTIGIPPVWIFVRPKYQAQAAIHVAPVVYSFLFPDRQSDNVLPMYESFKNTQAEIMLSEMVLQRVADELADKNLPIFEKKKEGLQAGIKQAWKSRNLKILFQDNADPIRLLRAAISKGSLKVTSERRSELITIRMESTSAQEGLLVVSALVRAYEAIVLSQYEQGEDKKMADLISERQRLSEQVDQLQGDIYRMAEQYGTSDLQARQNVMLENVKELQSQLTQIQASREAMQAQVGMVEQSNDANESLQGPYPFSERDLLSRRSQYLNNDERLKRLTSSLIGAEEGLIRLRQTLSPENPELKRQEEYIAALNQYLENRRSELVDEFKKEIQDETTFLHSTFAQNQEQQQKLLQDAIVKAQKHEKLVEERLQTANDETIKLGREHLLIKKRQDQLALTKGLYDTIRQRIQQMEMERRRPARISVAFEPSVVEVGNKSIKFMLAVVFTAFACGLFLAFLRNKTDLSLHSPDDVTRLAGLPIIGTTLRSSRQRDIKALPERLDFDYQTIRANLKLLNDGVIPKRLAISSPLGREGKTTLAINLAISLARSGREVLLIDGDLRKPDIAHLLNIKNGSKGLAEVVLGTANITDALWRMPKSTLSVLPSKVNRQLDIIELLSRPSIAKFLDSLAEKYDHIIIDTPPILAAPEALLWARLAGPVVVSSFAGYTSAPVLKEAIARLTLANVRVLGNVMSNVRAGEHYGAYGYAYQYPSDAKRKKTHQESRQFLLQSDSENGSDTEQNQN